MNAWRVLASFVAAFTLIWGLWAGLTRRKPVLLVLWCLSTQRCWYGTGRDPSASD